MKITNVLLVGMIRNAGQAHHYHLPVPEWRQDVGVGGGQADRLYRQLERDRGDDVAREQVPQCQVPVLVSVQQTVVTGNQA